MKKFEQARQKYKPENIKYLLVAETPPKLNSSRFFYFEKVDGQDSLFIETMKVLYPSEINELETKEIRKRKKYFLEKFKNDGFYLIDSIDKPFEEKYNPRQKIQLIEKEQNNLLKKINHLVDEKTKVILIAAPVYKANFEFLKQSRINVINKESIDFPGSGGQIKFRTKISSLLKTGNNKELR